MTVAAEFEWGKSYQEPQLFHHPEISSGFCNSHKKLFSSLFTGHAETPNGITEIIAPNDFIHNQPYAKIIMSPR